MTYDDIIRAYKEQNPKKVKVGEARMCWENQEEVKQFCEGLWGEPLPVNDDGSFTYMGIKHFKK